MTNSQVKRAFMAGKPGTSVNLSTDGVRLMSYHWWQVAKWVNGSIIVRKGRSYSTTTATRHRPGVYGIAANIETPADQANMEV